MTEFIETPLTPEQIAEREAWEAGAFDREVALVNQQRQSAYVQESDPLNFKWQETGLEADKKAWLDKKAEIKERYPDPVKDTK